MKQAAFILWLTGTLMLGLTGAAGWQLVAGLLLLPAFFIGKPWYSHLKGRSIEQK
ncbi:MAG: hypothetical protein ACQEV0_02875 [Bacillota bacterium]